MSNFDRVIAGVLTSTDASLKRIAWAYGCTKKGSDEEAMLRPILLAKLAAESPSMLSTENEKLVASLRRVVALCTDREISHAAAILDDVEAEAKSGLASSRGAL